MHAFKKIIPLLLLCAAPAILFAQTNKDSLALAEMQRLNRMGDSLYKLRLAKDSAFLEELNQKVQKTKEEIASPNQKEIEAATQQVMEQQRKEQGRRKNIIFIALAAFITATMAAVLFLQRRQQKT